jgi:glycosyltransferase involved in cell wall biosynthesis
MNKKYNIIILCGVNPYSGGGIIALDMMNAFEEDGHEVKIISNEYFEFKDKNIISISRKKEKKSFINIYSLNKTRKRILQFLKKSESLSKYNMFSLKKQVKISYSKCIVKKLNKNPDFFIYMFSHNFLTPNDLKFIYNKTNSKILFWLMDSAAMTGGCHFTWNCKGYVEYCGNCPGIKSNKNNDLTNKNMLQKHEVFNQIELYAIYGGEKMKQMLLESSLFKDKEIYKAPPPIDKDYYTNALREKSCEELEFPKNKKLIFIAANQLSSERKGMKILLQALDGLSKQLADEDRKNIFLIIAGNNIKAIEKDIPFEYKYLGFLPHDGFAKAIRSVHLFICPSIEDYGPMVINQSFMSGTPVVAFDMGVASEIIHTGITGYRAKLGDVEDLTKGIKYVLDLNAEKWQSMSDNCRALALNEFSVERVRNYFYHAFTEILNDKN